MANRKSIFFDEWRACLRAHFFFVVQIDDQITLASLKGVLREADISDEQIEAWRQEALAQRAAEGPPQYP